MGAPDQAEHDPVISIRIPEELNEQIDDIWRERGYASRSEFVRDALRTAVNPPVRLSEEALEHIRVSREQMEAGDTVSLDELD